MKSAKIKPARIWMPKCRAVTFTDKRIKRNKTRQQQQSRAMRDQ